MKIGSLTLENFRGIRQLTLQFSNPLTLLVGVNGAGKSTVLDAIALMLSWPVARIRNPRAQGQKMSNILDIHNDASYSRLTITLVDEQAHSWTMVRTRAGRMEPKSKSDYLQLSDYAKQVRERIDDSREHTNIPLFVYYPVNRAVLDIPLRIRQKHSFDLLDSYADSLTSGADFRSFFEWFRNREDLENENRKYRDRSIKPDGFEFPDRQLQAVRLAFEQFLPEYRDFSVRRNPLRMVVTKQGAELRIDQLSDGEKCLIAMIGDLARRLAIANPVSDSPLHGAGLVLIDEIDLHLHPAWQRMVPRKLIEVFPHCQFILSTHSPQVIGEVDPRAVRQHSLDEQRGIVATVPEQTFGLTSDDILDEIMRPAERTETLTRNPEIEKKLQELFEVIDAEQFGQARQLIEELRTEQYGDTPELIRAISLITMLEGSDRI